ncbi:ATP-binding protein [Kineosporia sp. J2-2]|uniref:ATP-binding protein n=1 Tax=Kineosporia corallincola TaxID=2835133 RepID=A0ABS5TL18_9ACTN|nr:ATP-binding protein [Kineosporia corallincola]MBT0771771.1 ATP-binding protein [Kineosporia corallincola]
MVARNTGRRKAPNEKLPAGVRLPIRRLDGGMLWTADRVQQWYELPGTRWYFRSNEQRESGLKQTALAWASAAGVTATKNGRTRVHLRVTTRPYDAAQWARDYDRRVREHSTPLAGDAWSQHLVTPQQAMVGRLNLADTRVFCGVDVADRSMWEAALAKAGGSKEARRVDAARRQVDNAMSMPGLSAHPISADDLEWLVHRSYGLHMPAPSSPAQGEPMGPEDMATFTDGVDIEQMPDGHSVRLTSRQPGREVVRYVTVLAMGRQRNDQLDIPGSQEPWMAYARTLPFAVEISAHVEILTGEQALKSVKRALDRVRDNLTQRRKHGLDIPRQKLVVEQQSIDVTHQLEQGDDLASSRVIGQVRFAVSGSSEEEVAARVLEIQTRFRQYQIEMWRPRGQRALVSEFVPGARVSSTSHTRYMQPMWWAAAVPTLDASVGTRDGYYLGWTVGASRRPVCWDQWEALYNDQTGLLPIIAELGGGKSFLAGMLVAEAVKRGVTQATVLDPSGPLARLCDLPSIAAVSQHVDLLSAPAGTLNPWTVVPIPDDKACETHEEWMLARLEAERERITLAKDVIMMLLPQTYLSRYATTVLVNEAVHHVGGDYNRSLYEVIEALRNTKSPDFRVDAHALAVELKALSDEPLSRLFFGSSSLDVDHALDTDARLLVLTMPGLTLPVTGSDPTTWTTGERIARPLQHLAMYLASKRAYGGPRELPKLLVASEAHHLTQSAAGKALFTRLTRDSRKWRLRYIVDTQLGSDVLGQTGGGLTVECFVGRTESPEGQAEALKMLRVPAGIGFERVLGELSPVGPDGRRAANREFLFRDARGRVEKIVVDCPDPDLALALSPDKDIPQAWIDHARRVRGERMVSA